MKLTIGSLISDRTTKRTKLEAKKQRLESSLPRVKLPLRELKSVPVPRFKTELVTLKQAQFKLDAIADQIVQKTIELLEPHRDFRSKL